MSSFTNFGCLKMDICSLAVIYERHILSQQELKENLAKNHFPLRYATFVNGGIWLIEKLVFARTQLFHHSDPYQLIYSARCDGTQTTIIAIYLH